MPVTREVAVSRPAVMAGQVEYGVWWEQSVPSCTLRLY
jgi:hypothetical protein